MSCRKGWSREILADNLTQKFVTKTYKVRRENLLLEREKSMLPATQQYVELEKEDRRLKHEIKLLEVEETAAAAHLSDICSLPLDEIKATHNCRDNYHASITRHSLITAARKAIMMLKLDIGHLEWQISRLNNHARSERVDAERRVFVRACPADNCRGFLNTSWKCGICEMWSCPTCHEVKGATRDEEHVCNPDNVATAVLLAKDSRSCPKCSAMIFKIDGCDQMYCTQCHTAFSWRRGTIEEGHVHNPHYFEFLRTHGGVIPRAPGDVRCGGMPYWDNISVHISGTFMKASELQLISNAYRSHLHVQFITMPRYLVTGGAVDNRDLRVKFMIGDIDENTFKNKIQQREKARQRKNDISQVLEMFTDVLVDLFQAYERQINNNIRQREAIAETLIQSLTNLRKHVNETLLVVSKRYCHCAVPRISESYETH